MCREMPVNLVNRVVDNKGIIGKIEGRGEGGEAQGVADPKNWKSAIRRGTVVRIFFPVFISRNWEKNSEDQESLQRTNC
jgi:hypothetical protein